MSRMSSSSSSSRSTGGDSDSTSSLPSNVSSTTPPPPPSPSAAADAIVGPTALMHGMGVMSRMGISGLPIRKIRVACALCQSSKQKCDDQRPCRRCVTKGKSQLCFDRTQDLVESRVLDTSIQLTQAVVPDLPPKRHYKKRKTRADSEIPEHKTPEEVQRHMSESIMKCLTDSIPEMLQTIHEEYSPLFIKEWVLHHTSSWKMYLTTMRKFLGDKKMEDIRASIRSSVAQAVATDRDKTVGCLLLAWIEQAEFFNIRSYSAKTVGGFTFPPQIVQFVRSVFNVADVASSDLAILRCSSVLNPTSNDVDFAMQANVNFERMSGRSMDELGDLTKKSHGDASPPPFVWVMSKDSWHEYTKFMILSYFQQELICKMRLNIAHADGRTFPCLSLLVAEYDPVTRMRDCVTMILKPISITFDPDFEDY